MNREHQDVALVNAIKRIVAEGGGEPVTIQGIDKKIINAYKLNRKYTDVVLITDTGEELNISCKGLTAPSWAGGGLSGMKKTLSPDISLLYNLYLSIIKCYDNIGLVDGCVYSSKNVPDVTIEVPESLRLSLIKGVWSMGGPVHYMYIGPIYSILDEKTKQFKGMFISVENYAKSGDFYFRARKRDLTKSSHPNVSPMIRYTPNVINKRTGLPKILTTATNITPIKGRNAMRIVISNRITGIVTPLINSDIYGSSPAGRGHSLEMS